MRASVATAVLSCAIYAGLSSILSCKAEAADGSINECGPVVNVGPSTLTAATGGSGCKTLVLASGTYAKLSISNRTSGVLTLRCAVQGKCVVGTGSVISNVNGLIIDGIQISGGSMGLRIKGGSRNVLVRNSTFVEQTAAGVTVGIGTQNDNIQIQNNEFRNAKLGCQYTNTGNCSGRMPDGSPIAEMDYAVRVYDTDTVEITGNRFGTTFNHAISLKYSVVSALIADNTFASCGRTCVELGQDSPSSDTAVVSGNTFQGARYVDVYVKN
ncbi:MAG: hypothetical protein ACJ8AW_01065, partial [Rhodopila sp.]